MQTHFDFGVCYLNTTFLLLSKVQWAFWVKCFAIVVLKLDDDILIGQRRCYRANTNIKFVSVSSFAMLKIASSQLNAHRTWQTSEKEKFNEGQRHSLRVNKNSLCHFLFNKRCISSYHIRAPCDGVRLSLLRLIQACKKQKKNEPQLYLLKWVDWSVNSDAYFHFIHFIHLLLSNTNYFPNGLTGWFESFLFFASLCVCVCSSGELSQWFDSYFFLLLNWIARAQSVTDSVVPKWFWHGQRTHFTRLSLNNSLKWTLDKLTCHLNWITLIKFDVRTKCIQNKSLWILPGWVL